MTRIEPVLGACHLGFTAGVTRATCWLDDGTLVIGHGRFVSWCDPTLKELHREELPTHVHSVSAFADGGVAVSADGLVALFGPDRQPRHRIDIEGVWTVCAHHALDELAVIVGVVDPESGISYRIGERWGCDGERRGTYGVRGDMLASYLETPAFFTPNLDVAFGSAWWGMEGRAIGGQAGKVNNREARERCVLDDDHVLLFTGSELQKVRWRDGEIVARRTIEGAGRVDIDVRDGEIIMIVDSRQVQLLDADLEPAGTHDFGNNLRAAIPSPDRRHWLLAFSPDDVTPRTLAIADADGKQRKLASAVVPVTATVADESAFYLGTTKGVIRMTDDAMTMVNIKAGAPQHMARVSDEVAVFGSKLVFADAHTLNPRCEVKIRASSEYVGLWTDGRDLVATSGARRALLRNGQLAEAKNAYNAKHVLATLLDGELVYVDNHGWSRPDEHRVLELIEDEWYAAAVSRDGERWAIDYKAQGVRVFQKRGKEMLCTVPHDPDAVVVSLTFAPGGRHLAIGRIGRVDLVAIETGDTLRAEHPGQCLHASFSPSGDTLFATLSTHLGGPFGDLVPGEVRAYATVDLSMRYRLIAGKDAVLKIMPNGDFEALGKAQTAAKLAVAVDEDGNVHALTV